MKSSSDIERYLELPAIIGLQKKITFQSLKDCFKNKVEGWNVRFLSQDGKKVFVKSVLQLLPTYAMTCFVFLKSLYDELEKIMGRFWW